jgi:WD40 repeat protein
MYLIGTRPERFDIWDCHSQQHLATLKSSVLYHPGVYSCSSDSRLLAICSRNSQQVVVWDISCTEDCIELPRILPFADAVVNSVCFAKNSEQLIVGYNFTLAIFDARTGSILRGVDMHGPMVFTSSENRIYSISWRGTVKELDINFTEIRRTESGMGFGSACMSPSEDLIAVVGYASPIVIIDLATFSSRTVSCAGVGASKVQFNNDGSRILVHAGHLKLIVVDAVHDVALLSFVFGGGVWYSLDSTHIYGSSQHGDIICLDAESGSAVPCQFSPPLTPCYHCYVELFVSAVSMVLM